MTEYLTSGDAADWLSHNGMKNTLARSGVTTHVIRFISSVGPGKSNLPFELRRKAGDCSRVTAGPIDLI